MQQLGVRQQFVQSNISITPILYFAGESLLSTFRMRSRDKINPRRIQKLQLPGRKSRRWDDLSRRACEFKNKLRKLNAEATLLKYKYIIRLTVQALADYTIFCQRVKGITQFDFLALFGVIEVSLHHPPQMRWVGPCWMKPSNSLCD
jgi:hypothetical protein